jgi:hypothetical protein
LSQNLKNKKIEIMKTIEKVLLLMFLLTCGLSNAQTSDKNLSTITPPKKTEIRYYYFPNLEAYFDLQEKVYLYKENGEWTEAEELPTNYGGYSLYNKVKVVIEDYDGDEPYLLLAVHKKMFPYNAKGRFTNQSTSTASSE